MITKSQKVLLMAIKAALFGTKPYYPAETDWDEVVKEAKAHTVLGIISPVIPVHDESVEQGKANYMRILYEQNQLIKLFDEHNIPCVILKGTAAAIYYPKPYLRAMGDVDILVPRNKFYKAVKLMEENGYFYTHGKTDGEFIAKKSRHIGYYKNGIDYELHHHFSFPGLFQGLDLDNTLEKSILKRKNSEINSFRFSMLTDVENGLVILCHIYQHLKENSLGLRQVIDWEMYFNSVMNKSTWNRFVILAGEIGLLPLAINITKMCEKYLGLPNRIQWKNKNDEITDGLINVILTDGNFGRRELSSSTNEKTIQNNLYSIGANGFYNHFLNVGKEKWELCQKYAVLNPLAFIYGLVRCGYKGVKIAIKTGDIKKYNDIGKNRLQLYKKLGIQFDAKR